MASRARPGSKCSKSRVLKFVSFFVSKRALLVPMRSRENFEISSSVAHPLHVVAAAPAEQGEEIAERLGQVAPRPEVGDVHVRQLQRVHPEGRHHRPLGVGRELGALVAEPLHDQDVRVQPRLGRQVAAGVLLEVLFGPLLDDLVLVAFRELGPARVVQDDRQMGEDRAVVARGPPSARRAGRC